ncbi:hypothetical protein IF1G_06443 [Cordyceps javanica]|uniref:Uncharacterized protein n=1 Tax=Cordyceps javanica TaxID=43265 RepID=A0A545VLN7_9HYPO|nr:hypothetical protein IF1G_06443 [Cordyceps javanica]TQW02600.1 hypothetical protein IF2G_09991 [Cordyceps javanica]
MSQIINTLIQAKLYNSFLIDHDATHRSEVVGLKKNHVPRLIEILEKHKLCELLEPHLLHRHFDLQEGEILVHRDLHVVGDSSHATVDIGIAKMIEVYDPIKHGLVPLLWMISTEGNLVAYEFGIKETLNTVDTKIKAVPADKWSSFIEEFTNYVQSNGLSDIVSLKNRGCLNGGEYTAGGTVAYKHVTEEIGPDAIDPAEVPQCYIDAMWAAQKSEAFWRCGVVPVPVATA